MLSSLLQVAQDAPAAAAPTPAWVAVAAFVVSLVLAVIRVAEFIAAKTERAKLSVVLTRDLFFRYTEFGETLFINSVLFATEKPAIITDVRGTLRKKDNTKSFPLRFHSFGEPKDRGQAVFDHYFFSSSPIDLLPVDVPIRRVYMCVLSDYERQMTGAITTLQNRITQLTPRIQAGAATPDNADLELAGDLALARDEFMMSFIDAVQLEKATYVVELNYEYRETRRRSSATSVATAAIEFTIGQPVRDVLRVELNPSYGNHLVLRALGKAADVYRFPAISPDDVRPVS